MQKILSLINRTIQAELMLLAMPWLFIGALLPAFLGLPSEVKEINVWLLIIGAFFFARAAGMFFNRAVDYKFDRENPRTQKRPLVTGELSLKQAWGLGIGSLVIFIFICFLVNPTVFLLSPFMAFLIWGYSYTKRFTALCHFVLGLVQFCAPFCAYLAMKEEISSASILIGMSSLLVFTGCDIIYQMADIEFDRAKGLYNLPAKLGINTSLWIARGVHLGAIVCLYCISANVLWRFGVLSVASTLCMHHFRFIKTRRWEFFLSCNAQVGLTILLFTLLGCLWPA